MVRQARRESGGQAYHDNRHPEPVVHLSVSSATRLRRESAEAERVDCPVKPDNDNIRVYGQTLRSPEGATLAEGLPYVAKNISIYAPVRGATHHD